MTDTTETPKKKRKGGPNWDLRATKALMALRKLPNAVRGQIALSPDGAQDVLVGARATVRDRERDLRKARDVVRAITEYQKYSADLPPGQADLVNEALQRSAK